MPSRGITTRPSGFNPRACERRELEGNPARRPLNSFQSTRLREARNIGGAGWLTYSRFNPRACERRELLVAGCFGAVTRFNPRACERREYSSRIYRVYLTFQSTRLREARIHSWSHRCDERGFNPRACERREKNFVLVCCNLVVSIHAPARGANRARYRHTAGRPFQSTRLREARRHCYIQRKWIRRFNPRACERREGDSL